jgi:hypothetical protein
MAAPSRSGWHGLAPEKRVCAGCGKKLTLLEPGGLWFDGMRGLVFHGGCWLPWVKASAA